MNRSEKSKPTGPAKPADARARKREQVLRSTPAPRRWVLPLLGALVVGGALAAYFAFTRGGGGNGGGGGGEPSQATLPPTAAAAVSGTGQIRIPLSDLADGRAKFFEHSAPGGGRVRFFALRDSDGTHRAALDACEICYHARKGYFQRGREMVCRKCGNSYAPVLIDESPGGCHPIALPRRVEAGHLVIMAGDVERIDAEAASRPPGPRRPMGAPMGGGRRPALPGLR